MAEFVLTDDEKKTVAALIDDWGFEYGLGAEREKVIALAERLGLHDWVKRNK